MTKSTIDAVLSPVAQIKTQAQSTPPSIRPINVRNKKKKKKQGSSKTPAFDAAAYSFFDFGGGAASGGGLEDDGGLEVRIKSLFSYFFFFNLFSFSTLAQPLSLSLSLKKQITPKNTQHRPASTRRPRKRASRKRSSSPRKMAWTP